MRSQALESASRRIVWVRLGGLALVLVLAGRAGHLTVAHKRARTLYEQQIRTEQSLSAARGTIVDRDGRELAVTTEAASVYALPRLLEDRAATAAALAVALGLDAGTVAGRLAAHKNFTYIARWVDPEAVSRVRALNLPGISIDLEPRRFYPAGKLAAPLIGFANIDGRGVRGIEQIEDEWLTGQPRRVRVERDARGRTLALHSTNPRDVQGGEIALTLDAAMQGAAEAALEEAVTQHGALGGLVLTLDPRNGDLLALAEAPGFDPNHFRQLDYGETRARAFTDFVEAGSTMKVFLVASALDSGLIEPRDEFDTEEGWLRVRGKTIRDRRPFGLLTPADILRVSSNVGAVQIAQLVGREAQYRGLLRFGFGSSTHSAFPMESPGLVRDWPAWKPVDQAAIAYGQGLSVTAIQLGAALATLANDGERMQPRLVLARRRTGEAWQTTEVRSRGHAVSADAARLTLDMMQTVVGPEGTGRLAGLADVAVAGKTGTAQKLDHELGRYSQDRYIAWFIGVVPADDPELAIVVALDEPSGPVHSGGAVAAPLFARVAASQLGLRGIVTEPRPIAAPKPPVAIATSPPPQPQRDSSPARETFPAVSAAPPELEPDSHEEPPLAAVAAPPAGPAVELAAGPRPPPRTSPRGPAFVPDFSGQTITHAMHMAKHESLEVTTQGAIRGRVVSQFPVPGTLLSGPERTVRLRFAARREEG
ncbi:MAG: cell division protein [Deltaproteobacteria bacterium]|nr:cell division protein [Deltaproteobacteria bacterium]